MMYLNNKKKKLINSRGDMRLTRFSFFVQKK